MRYPDVRIYVVWVNQRVTDARDTIDVSSIPGARHYWDAEWATGRWFGERDLGGQGYTGAVYDVYYLFDGDATWDETPGPLVSSGAPVIYESERLANAVERIAG